MQDRAVLRSVENDRKITKEQDYEFLYEYQKAVLLALKEAGSLTEMQYRYAEGKLKEQRNEMACACIKNKISQQVQSQNCD